jgi:TusA-related sulfurtransferase
MKILAAFSFILFTITTVVFAHECPFHKDHMESKGDAVMGFDHQKTTHHFYIKEDGGIIEAEANDPDDQDTIRNIRAHLADIAKLFSEGNFGKPQQIHDQTPPGIPTMIELRKEIEYRAEDLETGGQVRIITKNTQAIKAIHEFLRFQIQEHHTGDRPGPGY